jgi:hypothetical protein
MTRIAYLGPRGSFAEAALRSLVDATTHELVPAVSVQAALDARSRALGSWMRLCGGLRLLAFLLRRAS